MRCRFIICARVWIVNDDFHVTPEGGQQTQEPQPSGLAGFFVRLHLSKSHAQRFFHQGHWQVDAWFEMECSARSPDANCLELVLQGDRYGIAYGMQGTVALGGRHGNEVRLEAKDRDLVIDTFSAIGRDGVDDGAQLLERC